MMTEKWSKTDLCQDGFAIVLGAGQACVEVTGLLGRVRWVVSYKTAQLKKDVSISSALQKPELPTCSFPFECHGLCSSFLPFLATPRSVFTCLLNHFHFL